jgi:hypothetical protein
MEVKKRRGRPPNPRASVLSPEAIARLRGDTVQTVETVEEANARREKDRLRKQADRKQERAEKAVEGIETKEDLWALNRSLLPETELNALMGRESRVLDILHWVSGAIAGTNDPSDEFYVSLEEGREDLEAFVKAHGVATLEIVLLPEYWKTPLYTEKFQHGTDGTSVFAKFGILTAFTDHRWATWQQFLVTRTATTTTTPPSPSGNGFTTMKCGCGRLPEAVQQSIADRYRELGIAYQCQKCRDLERKSRAESTMFQRGVPFRGGPQ